MEEITIQPDMMERQFYRVLVSRGMSESNARICADLFTTNSVEGALTHGVYRFPRFVSYIDEGVIIPNAEPKCEHEGGALEVWNGNSGPGPLNALTCTRRVMELSDKYGIGCVALAKTNHWMRGGKYGWIAGSAGYAFVGWTNTMANTAAWGAIDVRLGNNPLVIAAPYDGACVVLDMAMSQYSYGAMELAAMKGEKLPVPGGYDTDGQLTDDPTEIIRSRRSLPVGYWKGSGLALLLDILATSLSGGLSTAGISRQSAETGVSQVFVAFNLKTLPHADKVASMIADIIKDYKASAPESATTSVRYPGERALASRQKSEANGIPVQKEVWEEILRL